MSDNPYARPDDVSREAVPPRGVGVTLLKVFLGLGIIMLLLVLLLPFGRNGRGASRRVQCLNNLRNVGLALRNYESVHGTLPPAYTVDANGERLHSWRTLILPFIDEQSTYDGIDLSKPWNDPANAAAYENCPDVFRCPSADMPSNYTAYVGIVGPDGRFRASRMKRTSPITTGSAPLMVIEVSTKDAVHWMSPQDTDEHFVLNFGAQTEPAHIGGTQAVFGNGSVRFLSDQLSGQERQAMISLSDAPNVSAGPQDAGTQE
jgi:hypothetical protein